MNKKLYRVTFQTPILVLASDEREAERVGHKFLGEELKNGCSEVWNTVELNDEDQLRREERHTLPWWDGYPEGGDPPNVNEILRESESNR